MERGWIAYGELPANNIDEEYKITVEGTVHESEQDEEEKFK